MKAKNLQKMFDEGKDVTSHLDLSKARRPGHEQRRVNVDFPSWIIDSLDAQASHLGVTRQSVIKLRFCRAIEGRTEESELRQMPSDFPSNSSHRSKPLTPLPT